MITAIVIVAKVTRNDSNDSNGDADATASEKSKDLGRKLESIFTIIFSVKFHNLYNYYVRIYSNVIKSEAPEYFPF